MNVGLGLRLADNTKNGEIGYGVIAGLMWLSLDGAIQQRKEARSKVELADAGEKLSSSSSGCVTITVC